MLTWKSLISQFVHQVEGNGVKRVDGEGVVVVGVIEARYKFYFILVHDNLGCKIQEMINQFTYHQRSVQKKIRIYILSYIQLFFFLKLINYCFKSGIASNVLSLFMSF